MASMIDQPPVTPLPGTSSRPTTTKQAAAMMACTDVCSQQKTPGLARGLIGRPLEQSSEAERKELGVAGGVSINQRAQTDLVGNAGTG